MSSLVERLDKLEEEIDNLKDDDTPSLDDIKKIKLYLKRLSEVVVGFPETERMWTEIMLENLTREK